MLSARRSKSLLRQLRLEPWKLLLSFFAHVAGHALFMFFWKEAFLEGCGYVGWKLNDWTSLVNM